MNTADDAIHKRNFSNPEISGIISWLVRISYTHNLTDPARGLSVQSPTYDHYITELVTKLIKSRNFADDNLIHSKDKNKELYDTKANPTDFKLGDYVLLVSGPKVTGLKDHRAGPYLITQIKKNNDIKIKMERKSKVVNANRLLFHHMP